MVWRLGFGAEGLAVRLCRVWSWLAGFASPGEDICFEVLLPTIVGFRGLEFIN